MKEILKKKLNKKGFTLAELLIVVAIIAVLVAIAIPTFSAASTKAYKGVAEANARSAYAEWAIAYIADGTEPKANDTVTYYTGGFKTVCTAKTVSGIDKGDLAMTIEAKIYEGENTTAKYTDEYTFNSTSQVTTSGS